MHGAPLPAQNGPKPDWSTIDTVLLDLDGTLLDQAYDNHIWRDLVPQRFAIAQGFELRALVGGEPPGAVQALAAAADRGAVVAGARVHDLGVGGRAVRAPHAARPAGVPISIRLRP